MEFVCLVMFPDLGGNVFMKREVVQWTTLKGREEGADSRKWGERQELAQPRPESTMDKTYQGLIHKTCSRFF